MSRATLRLTAALTAVTLASACASTTVIRSQPPGAKVYLDGMLVGQTPYAMTDTKIVGATTHVQLKLDGHEDLTAVITRSEEFSPGACLGGVLFLFPFLWIQGYWPERTYEMTPLRYPPPGYPGYYGPQGYYPPPGAAYPQPYGAQQPAQQYVPAQPGPAPAPQQYAPPHQPTPAAQPYPSPAQPYPSPAQPHPASPPQQYAPPPQPPHEHLPLR